MRHTDAEIQKAARRFARLADDLDPRAAIVESTEDLRDIAAASQAVVTAQGRLRDVVEHARKRGRSWNQIAVALGVSRQAARQRFSGKIEKRTEPRAG